MKIDPNNRESESRDRLIVSKGHCVLAYYTALNRFGFLSDKEIEQFEQNGAFYMDMLLVHYFGGLNSLVVVWVWGCLLL